MFYDQSEYDLRCEWALPGIQLVGNTSDVVIIVDVCSFTTCVDVAVARGATIFPYRWRDETAQQYATQVNAELAVGRGKLGRFSLSPASMQQAFAGARIVLPSQNGSHLTTEAQKLGNIVIAGCLRNARAVAKYAASQGRTITLIPSGERWPDGTLRPAVEDLVAAGAILAQLPGAPSPEAQAAVAVWKSAQDHVSDFILSCVSGRELIERGFAEDVKIAREANVSMAVPVLRDQAFIRLGS